jgi:hypothetical protein
MKKIADTLLDQKMNRREFMLYLGGAFLALIGISGMIDALLKHPKTNESAEPGYGATFYGKQ